MVFSIGFIANLKKNFKNFNFHELKDNEINKIYKHLTKTNALINLSKKTLR